MGPFLRATNRSWHWHTEKLLPNPFKCRSLKNCWNYSAETHIFQNFQRKLLSSKTLKGHTYFWVTDFSKKHRSWAVRGYQDRPQNLSGSYKGNIQPPSWVCLTAPPIFVLLAPGQCTVLVSVLEHSDCIHEHSLPSSASHSHQTRGLESEEEASLSTANNIIIPNNIRTKHGR